MNISPRQTINEIRHLARAGATQRQIVRLTKVAPNTVAKWIHTFRAEDEANCQHGVPLWRCTYCHSIHGKKPLNELYGAIGLPVIWNVWVKRTDGRVYNYRMPFDRKVAEDEVENLKNADPRCQIADAWFNRFHPDKLEGEPL